jgi:aromatic-L-amino-acid decarboxylase
MLLNRAPPDGRARGRLYLTRNLVKGRFAIRFAVGQTTTTRTHVQEAWARIQETARALEV